MNNGELPLVPHPVHADHGPLKSKVLVDLDDVGLADADGGSLSIERVIAIRDKGAQTVVAAKPLEDHQDLPLRGGQGL